eukprot:scaffold34625_cov172-Amphora_coffeaeformis.AAC.5
MTSLSHTQRNTRSHVPYAASCEQLNDNSNKLKRDCIMMYVYGIEHVSLRFKISQEDALSLRPFVVCRRHLLLGESSSQPAPPRGTTFFAARHVGRLEEAIFEEDPCKKLCIGSSELYFWNP